MVAQLPAHPVSRSQGSLPYVKVTDGTHGYSQVVQGKTKGGIPAQDPQQTSLINLRTPSLSPHSYNQPTTDITNQSQLVLLELETEATGSSGITSKP